MSNVMRVLFCTQIIDKEDPALSFFHSWIKYFAPTYKNIKVICLKKGKIDLPKNVEVFSLNKEKYNKLFFRKILYIFKLLYLTYKKRHEYDVVFVHMNQEYVLACGWLWKFLGKPICLWYNHYSGSVFTKIATTFCKKVFYTSNFSYTAQLKKSVKMPVGVDTEKFNRSDSIKRMYAKALFLGRITKSKNLDVFIEALIQVNKIHNCVGAIYGPTITEQDKKYLNYCMSLIKDNVNKKILFNNGIASEKTPEIYSSANIFINCSKSGMYDKTIFEAAACGCIVISSSIDFKHEAGEEHFFDLRNSKQLADRIIYFLSMSKNEQDYLRQKMRHIAERHSINSLNNFIYKQLSEILKTI